MPDRELPIPSSAADDLAAWAGPKKPAKAKAKPRGVSDKAFLGNLKAIEEMLATNTVKDAKGEHFVALVADLHFRVYGIVDETLTPIGRLGAAVMARKMLKEDFAGDAREMADYVRWLWTRQKDKETFKRDKGFEGGRRLDWRGTFGKYNLVDYRLAKHRTVKQGPAASAAIG